MMMIGADLNPGTRDDVRGFSVQQYIVKEKIFFKSISGPKHYFTFQKGRIFAL
jgi:hypothetical protein